MVALLEHIQIFKVALIECVISQILCVRVGFDISTDVSDQADMGKSDFPVSHGLVFGVGSSVENLTFMLTHIKWCGQHFVSDKFSGGFGETTLAQSSCPDSLVPYNEFNIEANLIDKKF